MLRRKCIQLNALRIDGKCTESTNWDEVKQRFAITDRQVLELKSRGGSIPGYPSVTVGYPTHFQKGGIDIPPHVKMLGWQFAQ